MVSRTAGNHRLSDNLGCIGGFICHSMRQCRGATVANTLASIGVGWRSIDPLDKQFAKDEGTKCHLVWIFIVWKEFEPLHCLLWPFPWGRP